MNPLNMGSEADADLGGFDSGAEMPLGPGPTFLQKAAASCEVVYAFVDKHFFLIFVLVAILVAFAEPSIGNQVEPSITTGYVATIIIFVISGMSLNTSEFIAAVKNVKLNTFVLVYNMGIITILTWLAAQLLGQTPFSKELRDGLIILGTLPTSVSMCVILTTAASGDAAAALFNSTTLNLVGIFLTPAWLLGLLSTHTSISVGEVILTLTIKVVAPLLFGQVIRYIPNSFLQKQLKVRLWQLIYLYSHHHSA